MSDDETRRAFIQAIHADPFCAITRGVYADWLDEHGDDKRALILRAGNMPLTGLDEACAYELAHCRFGNESFDDRFSKAIVEEYTSRTPAWLTVKQWLWMWVLTRRYRKTVRNAGVKALAEKRYKHFCEVLDLDWLKPHERRLTVKNKARRYMLPTLFD